MEWLNYHHFLYFWVVAKEGSIAAASKKLRLAHPTISTQIHQLEGQLGEKLFERAGRGLVLTEFGRVALGYADEIFLLGREFLDTAKGRPSGRAIRLVVGVSDVLAKSIVYRMLEPVFQMEEEVQVVAREDRPAEAFVAELALHTVDVVLSDAPVAPGSPVRAFSHLLGECGTTFFAAPDIAKRYRRRFPESLEGAPVLLPGENSTQRRALERWFDAIGVRPKVVAEVEDPALAKVLAEAGLGIIAMPDVIEQEILERYKVKVLRRVEELPQRFYAISLERRVRNPAVVAICETARKDIFA